MVASQLGKTGKVLSIILFIATTKNLQAIYFKNIKYMHFQSHLNLQST